MDFDYYFKKYDEEYGFNDSELCGFEIGFEAGQQSKQEEVDRLKMSNHHLSVQVLDAEAYSDYWEKNHNRLQLEIDALKAELAKHQRLCYKLVPVEPTEDMLNAGMKECTYNTDDAIEIYKAMIGAAE